MLNDTWYIYTLSLLPFFIHALHTTSIYAIGRLRSSSGIRIYTSIAALKAAKPAQPTATACGPAFLARIPPVIHPPQSPLYKSFFARKPSIAHSVPENMAPILAKFLPDEMDDRYMSRRPSLSCWRIGRSVMGIAVVDPVGVRVIEGEAEAVAVEATVEGARGLLAFAASATAAVVEAVAVAGVGVGRG